MPNWCTTSYTAIGDKKELQELHDKMQELAGYETALVPNDFGPTWLGCLVTALGGDWKEIYCRGYYWEPDLEDDRLRFMTETAWGEPTETIAFLEEKFPNIRFFFLAEEPGMEYFVTNDSEGVAYDERYYINGPGCADATYYTQDEEAEFLAEVSQCVGVEVKSPEDAVAAAWEYNKDKDWEDMIEVRIYKVI